MAAFLATHIVQTPRGETVHRLDSVLLPQGFCCLEKVGYSGQRRTFFHHGGSEDLRNLYWVNVLLSIINQPCQAHSRRADCERQITKSPNHEMMTNFLRVSVPPW